MTWNSYLICFQILSPIHIGWKKTGNLQQTRPYVTGKTMWGALTNRLVRDQGNNNYQKIGKDVDNELRFTYFYPATDCDNVNLWPWESNNSDKFSWIYLGSYASTALKNKVTEYGMLHEIEYIASKTRNEKDIYLIGYVIEKDGCKLEWQNALRRIQIGGERGYGWGQVKIINISKNKDDWLFNKSYVFNGDNDKPQITIQEDKPILAHALIDGLNCNGTLEPLVGRETNKSNEFGVVISMADICWIPGSVVNSETKFVMLEKGILKIDNS